MSSFTRRLGRNIARRAATKDQIADHRAAKTQPTIVREAHYLVLHPTRGWRRVSYRRASAQQAMAYILTPRRYRVPA